MAQIFCLTLAFLLVYPPAKKDTCEDLWEGKFILDDGREVYHITRTLKKQIEVQQSSGWETHLKIKWIDDCNYILFDPETVSGKGGSGKHDNDTLFCKILSIKGDKHTVHAVMDGKALEFTLKKVE